MIGNFEIDNSQTPEKWQYLTTEVLEFLTEIMRSLDDLEAEIYKRHQFLSEGDFSNEAPEDEDELWEEYFRRCHEIIAPISTKPYKDNRSFGNPTQYQYLNDPKTKITLLIKSDSRATVEFQFDKGISKKEQFILKKDNDRWKIDTKKYGFPDEATWRKDEL